MYLSCKQAICTNMNYSYRWVLWNLVGWSSANMSFTAQEMKDLRVVFDVYDPSKSGFITIGDVRKVSDSKSQGILKLPKAVR